MHVTTKIMKVQWQRHYCRCCWCYFWLSFNDHSFFSNIPRWTGFHQKQNYYYNYNHFTALWTLSGTTRRNIHPLTPIVVINHPLSASSIF